MKTLPKIEVHRYRIMRLIYTVQAYTTACPVAQVLTLLLGSCSPSAEAFCDDGDVLLLHLHLDLPLLPVPHERLVVRPLEEVDISQVPLERIAPYSYRAVPYRTVKVPHRTVNVPYRIVHSEKVGDPPNR